MTTVHTTSLNLPRWCFRCKAKQADCQRQVLSKHALNSCFVTLYTAHTHTQAYRILYSYIIHQYIPITYPHACLWIHITTNAETCMNKHAPRWQHVHRHMHIWMQEFRREQTPGVICWGRHWNAKDVRVKTLRIELRAQFAHRLKLIKSSVQSTCIPTPSQSSADMLDS